MIEPALPPSARSLAIVGAALFLAGLLQGAAVDLFANPRMALSAHLDAVQSGVAVMVAALFWPRVRWNARTEIVARWTLAAGMVGLWLGITLAATTGASEALPMAGAGYSAALIAENAVTTIIVSSSAALTVGWALFLIGLIRAR
ncbi:hydrogenase [Pseudoblastomonas halimionae]|uniref:Hydrogenase n=1 Tax=Alteriqipengyuania halimionae TaxID=1926630 RepID=A0A6I4U3A5_9SPHN|nr:hydrogenase [Alteriqipengyuania halimionae]MXP10206.1 hydrogenase [Alteriqipengyuania halimionae]